MRDGRGTGGGADGGGGVFGGPPGFVLRQGLAHAHNRRYAVRQGSLDLLVDHLIGLAKVSPPLGVAQDDVLAKFRHHLWGHFTGVSPGGLPVHVLRSQPDPAACQHVRQGHQVGEGRAHGAIHPANFLQFRQQFCHQQAGFFARLVHFPVSGHKWFSHRFLGGIFCPYFTFSFEICLNLGRECRITGCKSLNYS